ncbi:MAG: hypothetical protein MUD01_28870 [Chloroflexaceae bacterium]|nr:hypothetical protein [Chloroflexaceae bacterium]
MTQIRKDSPFLAMPDDIATDLFGVEYFILVDSRVPTAVGEGEMEDDIFAGLR